MTTFELTERIVETRMLTLFVPDEEEADGSGWSYKAQSDGETIDIEFVGRFRRKHLPTLIALLETAAKEDTNRNEDFGSVESTFYMHDTEEDFREGVELHDKLTVGMASEDFWIANAASVDEKIKGISIITLLRTAGTYTVLEIGAPMLAFRSDMLEGVTELLRKFL